ncbi:hypothetical protein B0H16DRAFT_1894015, partial [Mycena metata]
MDSSAALGLSASHPLSELASLRALVMRFQKESHTASLNLQHHALASSTANTRIAQLEAQNALLQTDLRRLSTKLSLTEDALRGSTARVVESEVQIRKTGREREEAYALAARARAREEEGRVHIGQLDRELGAAREEGRRSEGVVGEYAKLVRRLEREYRKREDKHERVQGHKDKEEMELETGSSTTLVEPTPTPPTPGPAPPPKSPHYAAFFSPATSPTPLEAERDHLRAQLHTLEAQLLERDAAHAVLRGELDTAEVKLRAADRLANELGAELGKEQFQKERARVEDGGAAGVVERYMKF